MIISGPQTMTVLEVAYIELAMAISFLMIFLILFALVTFFYFGSKIDYEKIAKQASGDYIKLKSLNKKFRFRKIEAPDYYLKIKNISLFESISCKKALIHFVFTHKDLVLKGIEDANYNIGEYKEYIKHVEAECHSGSINDLDFIIFSSKRIRYVYDRIDTLRRTAELLVQQNTQHPTLCFSILVCIKLTGGKRKGLINQEVFTLDQIKEVLTHLDENKEDALIKELIQ